MKKTLSLIFSTFLCVMLLATSGYASTPAEELTEALQEVIQPPLSSEPLELDIKVTEYRVVEGHLADFKIEYTAKMPVFEIGGNLSTSHKQFSKTNLDNKTMLSSHSVFDLKDKSFLKGQEIKPIPKEEWEAHTANVKKLVESSDHPISKELYTIEFNAIKANDKGEIETFEVIVRPTEKNKDLLFDIRLMVEAKEGDSFSCDICLENNGRSLTIIDENSEKQVVEFLENIRKRDMATMMIAQSMIHLFKGYAGLAVSGQ